MLQKMKFVILSLLGILFFLVPFNINGESKIAISHISSMITSEYMSLFMAFTMACAIIVILASLIFAFYTSKHPFLNEIFKTSTVNVILRVVGSFLYLLVVNEWFSQYSVSKFILSPETGGLMAGPYGLLSTLYITFFVGVIALPLLTHFGLVEFIGILLGPFVEKVFRVPGYSTIDALTSFVGSGTVGIIVTDNQYKRGYYNRREAYIIATSFSIVGIAFASAVAEELGFGHIFPVFYGSIAFITIILAFMTSRLPLSKFQETYYEGVEPNTIILPENQSIVSYAFQAAIEQAEKVKVKEALKSGLKNVIHIYVSFLPIIMLVGTFSLIVAEYTSFFTVISYPFTYLYMLLGYSKETALAMAPASVAGFADMYLPALFISSTASEASRFFIGVLAFTQLVFMSETGMVLIKSSIDLSFWDVVKLFIFRTVMSIPLLFLITHFLAYLNVIAF